LLRNQIDEIFKVGNKIEAYFEQHPDEIIAQKINVQKLKALVQADSQYDLKNHYLYQDYVRKLLLADTKEAKAHIQAMFALSDEQKGDYATHFVELIRKIEQTFNVEIYPSDDDQGLHDDAIVFLTNSQDQLIATFEQNL